MLTLYTETLAEVIPVAAASHTEVQIPRKNGSYDRSKYSVKEKRGDNLAKDERTFQEQYLSTSSSVYFRHEKHYPRSFLWRVVQEKVLEVRPTDPSRPEKDHREACLSLRFEFQDPILPLGVSLADANNSNELHIFVATTKNELFNLRLPTESFRPNADLQSNISDWCKSVDVSSLSIDTIHQLHASNPYELFVAFAGGRIQRIHRKSDQEVWSQDNYDDTTWGSTIRGIVSRRGQQYIESGSNRLSLTAAQGMVASQDTTYLYTLCLNHTLRIWQLSTGKLVETRDLLDVERDPNERLQLNPAEAGLIRLVTFPQRGQQILITYSPHEGGQMKLWTIRGGLTGSLEIEDKFPGVRLTPPDPDPTGNTVWSFIGLEVVPGKKDAPSQIWVLWRNNNYHRAYTMHFEDLQSLPEAWESNWVAVQDNSGRPQAPDMVLTDPQDVTSKWLESIFYPGRYSASVLETALSRYQEITGTASPSSQKTRSLKERLCGSIASSTSLRKYDNAEMDYERFCLDTDHQWRNFWRILESLNDGRHAPLALAVDTAAGMAWIAMTDNLAAVRECSKIELITENEAETMQRSGELIAARWPHRKVVDDGALLESLARVLHAAHKFRTSFSPDLAYDFTTAIEEEMFTESETATPERIVLIFNQIEFAEGLSEGAEQQLLRDLEPLKVAGGLSSELINTILTLLSTYNNKRHKASLKTTLFGARLLSAALLDDIELTKNILLDLLTLVIFIDPTDIFDPPELFDTLLMSLKEQERSLWASLHSRVVPMDVSANLSKSDRNNSYQVESSNQRSVTIMEDIFMRHVRPQHPDTRPQMYLLTDMVADVQRWACGRDAVTYDDATVHMQCYLLFHGELELAVDFLRFQPRSPWSSYVKGRLRLARGDFAEAALYFRKAAYTLAHGKAIGDVKEMSAGLLSLVDAEHFNSGLPRYFQHIMGLFETKKAFPETAEFARLALQALATGPKPSVAGLTSELLSRLFTSELKRGNFDAAFESLARFSDRALQKSSATTLIDAILDCKASLTSGSGTLEILQRLPWSLHPHLAAHLDQCLTTLAKKQTSIPISTGMWTITSAVDYLSILYALRLAKGDYRAATAVLFDRLRIIQKSGRARSDSQAIALRQALLTLINAMTCVPSDEAYLLVDIDDDPRIQGVKRTRSQETSTLDSRKRQRVIVTLDDLRREYQQVLDKCSRIERGDFDFEVDESEDDEMYVSGTITNGDAMEM